MNNLSFGIYKDNIEVGHFTLAEHPELEFPTLTNNVVDNELEKAMCLSFITIKAPYRKLGYFNQALQYIESWAVRKGYRSIILYPDNESEIPQSDLYSIYQSKGYKPMKTDSTFLQKVL